MYRDSIGQEVNIGDKIAFIERGYRNHIVSNITSFSKAGIPRVILNNKVTNGEFPVRTDYVKIFNQN